MNDPERKQIASIWANAMRAQTSRLNESVRTLVRFTRENGPLNISTELKEIADELDRLADNMRAIADAQ